MGIKGLWTTILRDYAKSNHNFIEDVHSGSTLLVDANSFLFHLMDKQLPKLYNHLAFKREYGGSYYHLERSIRLELLRLQKDFNFTLIFYYDGPTSYYKADTAAKRRKQLIENWNALHQVTVGFNADQSQLPVPPLAFAVLTSILNDLNIKVVDCVLEADYEMARDCVRFNAETHHNVHSKFYCYSADSDFLIMKNCPLIALGSLDDPSAVRNKTHNKTYSIVVWRRSNLAKMYNLSEDLLVKLCLVIGNDFTSAFPREMIHPSLKSHMFIPDLQNWIYENGNELDYTSHPDDKVRLTCLYSERFYNLEDLTDLLLPEYKTSNPNLGDLLAEELEEGIMLQKEQKQKIFSWFHKLSFSEKEIESSEVSLGSLAIQCCRECFADFVGSSPSKTSSKDSGKLFSSDLSQLFTPVHYEILTEMIGKLKTVGHIVPNYSPSTLQAIDLTWENVVVANYFQLIAKELHRIYKNMLKSTDKSVLKKMPALLLKPTLVYDGLLFHSLYSRRQKSIPKEVSNKSENNSKATQDKKPEATKNPSQPVLPIDQYRDDIVHRIRRDRVVVLSGETGCGKSTRVPLYIYEDSVKHREKCKIIICQPRRIAVINLKNRLREALGDKIGMRMGHGVKDESSNTQIYFVTSGYLVRLLAHHPQALNSITHLVIDEVHERSFDNDLLCYLVKRNLGTYLNLKVILMSATLQATLYQNYFQDPSNNVNVDDSLSVGVRRFPVDILYVKDLTGDRRVATACRGIEDLCNNAVRSFQEEANKPAHVSVLPTLAKLQYDLVVYIVTKYCQLGTGVLVFVSGMADILDLQSKFELINQNKNDRYKVIAIHSDIPLEEQETALIAPEPNEIKVILATNAAESSVTLPNVDTVICLGTHKSIQLKPGDYQRSILSNIWISKSSAIQRGGRTGRIRPGKVFRLYTEDLYKHVMYDFNHAEIHCRPLHDIIITLKSIFEDQNLSANEAQSAGRSSSSTTNAVSHQNFTLREVLSNLVEVVNLNQLPGALNFLFKEQMITSPIDELSKLTSLGLFAGKSSVDYTLSKLIIYGITLGVGVETIIIAAALSQPKSFFRIYHPLIHSNPDEFNSIVQQTFLGNLFGEFNSNSTSFSSENKDIDDDTADRGNNLYSDPLSMCKLYFYYSNLSFQQQQQFFRDFGIVAVRFKHFMSTIKFLLFRCYDYDNHLKATLNLEETSRKYYFPPSFNATSLLSSSSSSAVVTTQKFTTKDFHWTELIRFPKEMIFKCKLVLLWTFHFNLLQSKYKKEYSSSSEKNPNSKRCLEMMEKIEIPQSSFHSIQDFLKHFKISSKLLNRLSDQFFVRRQASSSSTGMGENDKDTEGFHDVLLELEDPNHHHQYKTSAAVASSRSSTSSTSNFNDMKLLVKQFYAKKKKEIENSLEKILSCELLGSFVYQFPFLVCSNEYQADFIGKTFITSILELYAKQFREFMIEKQNNSKEKKTTKKPAESAATAFIRKYAGIKETISENKDSMDKEDEEETEKQKELRDLFHEHSNYFQKKSMSLLGLQFIASIYMEHRPMTTASAKESTDKKKKKKNDNEQDQEQFSFTLKIVLLKNPQQFTMKESEYFMTFLRLLQSLMITKQQSSSGSNKNNNHNNNNNNQSAAPAITRDFLFPDLSTTNSSFLSPEIFQILLKNLSFGQISSVIAFLEEHRYQGMILRLQQPYLSSQSTSTPQSASSYSDVFSLTPANKNNNNNNQNNAQKTKPSRLTCMNCQLPRSFFFDLFHALDLQKKYYWEENPFLLDALEDYKEVDLKYLIQFHANALLPLWAQASDHGNEEDGVVGFAEDDDYHYVDISNGMRLFNAYATGQKQNKMKVLSEPRPDDQDIGEEGVEKAEKGVAGGGKLVPGSVLWKLQKDSEIQQKKEGAGDDFDAMKSTKVVLKNVKNVPVKVKANTWAIIDLSKDLDNDHGDDSDGFGDENDMDDDDDDAMANFQLNSMEVAANSFGKFIFTDYYWKSASISNRSILSTSFVHIEKNVFSPTTGELIDRIYEPVYGVCFSTVVVVNATSGQSRVMCEGITLFPSTDWLRRGLLCIGKCLESNACELIDDPLAILESNNNNNNNRKKKKEAKKVKNNNQDDDEDDGKNRASQVAFDIYHELSQLKNFRIQEKPAVIALVNTLFREYF